MQKRYLYSSLLSSISFVILYLILNFPLYISLILVIIIYVGGIFLFREKDVRKYDPKVIMHYCYLISKIDNYRNLIKDDVINKNISDISTKAEKIVVMLEQKPDKITQVYNGFDYYLPRIIDILDQYIYLGKKDNLTSDEDKFVKNINNVLDYIENEIDKLLKNMNYTKMMDINASIEVFEKIKRDELEEGSVKDA